MPLSRAYLTETLQHVDENSLPPLTTVELDTHITAMFSLLPADDVDITDTTMTTTNTYSALTPTLIGRLCAQARCLLADEPSLLRLASPVNICGDIHGQFDHLLHVFNICGRPPIAKYLFLGDYVDRGRNSVETICLLLLVKCRYPSHIWLLRGNHECRWICRVYGTMAEVIQRYSSTTVWHSLVGVFDEMPLAAVVDKKMFCCHGGLSPQLNTLNDVELLKRGSDVPASGLTCDLLWSDPALHPAVTHWVNNHRQVSYLYGPRVVAEFCERNGIDFIVRAHQAQDNGYKWSPCGRVFTLFTAPNYCQMGNDGCVMSVESNENIQLRVLRQRPAASLLRSVPVLKAIGKPTTPRRTVEKDVKYETLN